MKKLLLYFQKPSRATPKGIKIYLSKGFLNFLQNSNSPILLYILDAKTLKLFIQYLLNKTFSTLLLSNEMFNKNQNI